MNNTKGGYIWIMNQEQVEESTRGQWRNHEIHIVNKQQQHEN